MSSPPSMRRIIEQSGLENHLHWIYAVSCQQISGLAERLRPTVVLRAIWAIYQTIIQTPSAKSQTRPTPDSAHRTKAFPHRAATTNIQFTNLFQKTARSFPPQPKLPLYYPLTPDPKLTAHYDFQHSSSHSLLLVDNSLLLKTARIRSTAQNKPFYAPELSKLFNYWFYVPMFHSHYLTRGGKGQPAGKTYKD